MRHVVVSAPRDLPPPRKLKVTLSREEVTEAHTAFMSFDRDRSGVSLSVSFVQPRLYQRRTPSLSCPTTLSVLTCLSCVKFWSRLARRRATMSSSR